MKKVSASRTFRPWDDIQERLEVAEDLGFNISQLINEVLEKHLREHMEKKAQRISRTLVAQS